MGANFALHNQLFERIPSLVNDAVGMFLPADAEDKDLFSKLPLREIATPAGGKLILTGQNDKLTVGYDKDRLDYTFTDSADESVLPTYTYSFNDEFSALSITADYTNRIVDVTAGTLSARYDVDSEGIFTCGGNTGIIYSDDGASQIEADDIGVLSVEINGSKLFAEYDTDINMLYFTSDDGETPVAGILTYSFPDTDFKDVSLRTEASSDGSLVRDVMAMYFYDNSSSSLLFDLINQTKIEMINYRTADAVIPQNAEHIGFEGKETLGSSRGYIWSRTLPLLKNCMLTGYGADTFTYKFPQNDVLAKYYAYQQYNEGFYITVDKPHNMYLQMFCSNGLIALIAFLGIVVFYLVDCFRLYALRREYRREQIMGAAIMLGVVGYLAAGMFNDSVVSVAPMFWVLLGVGASLNTINRRMDRNVVLDEEYTPVMEEKAPTPAQVRKDQQAVQAGEILAAAIRNEQIREQEKQQKLSEKYGTYTHENAQALLDEIRAMRSENDKTSDSAEETPEDSDDNS